MLFARHFAFIFLLVVTSFLKVSVCTFSHPFFVSSGFVDRTTFVFLQKKLFSIHCPIGNQLQHVYLTIFFHSLTENRKCIDSERCLQKAKQRIKKQTFNKYKNIVRNKEKCIKPLRNIIPPIYAVYISLYLGRSSFSASLSGYQEMTWYETCLMS